MIIHIIARYILCFVPLCCFGADPRRTEPRIIITAPKEDSTPQKTHRPIIAVPANYTVAIDNSTPYSITAQVIASGVEYVNSTKDTYHFVGKAYIPYCSESSLQLGPSTTGHGNSMVQLHNSELIVRIKEGKGKSSDSKIFWNNPFEHKKFRVTHVTTNEGPRFKIAPLD